MKYLLLFMFVAVALAAPESEIGPDALARSLARAFRIDQMDSLECIRKSEVTMEDLRYMEDVIDLSDSETTDMKSLKRATCAIVCCAQKRGFMVGGVVQVEELFKYFKTSGMPEDIEIQLRSIVRICKEQVTDTSDECMAGYKFMKCVYKRSQMIVQRK